ncbi:substrate-binding domain-containing protein [Robbsia sp. Bb-Pol-6]|uniref:Substrate-binding domain-containing protein n=1 Tax=Robbsia betulipollinis TaxID=2981849 RepID=A0ABT3ZSM8_9BURK|nr:substrate-binding domain-containing protein [Robbsia betulipollinis]MCY0389564.1 substrate-binding domain-containing protein [Robbsia betulipollinis]
MVDRQAADGPGITGISSMATRGMVLQLSQAHARASTQKVAIESVGGVAAMQRVRDGARFDFVVLAADAIDRLIADGLLVADSRVDIARSGVAVAVREGAARPDIGSEQAVRAAVLDARSVGYSTGPSGAHLMRLFARWGIADAIAPRLVRAPPGVAVGTLLAHGDVALGFQQSSELLHVSGIDIVGTLPSDIQCVTTFSAALCASSTQQTAARILLAFLGSADAGFARREHGMTSP